MIPEDVRKFYAAHLKQYGRKDIRGMGWFEEDEYSIRFDICCDGLDLNDASILDVGCGTGGLFNHLKSSSFHKFSYLGIDMMPEMVDEANILHPTGTFKVGDILSDKLGSFDYVFCIGTLNITSKDFSDYFFRMVSQMIEISKKGVVLNFLSDRSYLAPGPYHFQDPLDLKKWAEERFDVSVLIRTDERVLGESFVTILRN